MTPDKARRANNTKNQIAARWIEANLGCHLGIQYGPEDFFYCMCSDGRHRAPGSKKLKTLTAWPLNLDLYEGEEIA